MPEKTHADEAAIARTRIRQEASETIAELSEKLMCEIRLLQQQSGTTTLLVEGILQNHGLSPEVVEPDVLTDLVYAEWMLKLEQGESPSREEYYLRFPAIRHRLERQWILDESLADIASVTASEAVSGNVAERSDAQPFGSHYIGKYKIISPLGSGGQGDVYRALHPDLNRDVVIKLIRPRFQADSTIEVAPSDVLMKSALSEGRLLAQLSHPDIAQVFDIDQVYGYPFLVMEFVQGHSLDQYRRLHTLNAPQIATLLGRVAFAVAAAHERGILHRDIKPQNIVVSDDGSPKLIDFGLARISDLWETRDEHPGLCGTLAFLSPEQASGEAGRIGPATDVFALGAVLYVLLTGEPLYQGASVITGVSLEGLLERAKKCDWDRTALRNSRIPKGLAVICERALQPDPAARFASARQLADALGRFAKPRQVPVLLIAAAASVLAGGVLLFARSASENENSGTSAPLDVSATANITVLKPIIHQGDARIELLNAVPLKSDTLLHLESEIPSGVSFVLLSINGVGGLKQVATFPPRTQNWQWRYPEEPTEVLPLTGPAGTECLILLGTKDSEIIKRDTEANAFGATWRENSDWPEIAPEILLRVRGTKVIVEQSSRDLGISKRTEPNPSEKVTVSLEKFAERFQSTYPLIEGIAFRNLGVD